MPVALVEENVVILLCLPELENIVFHFTQSIWLELLHLCKNQFLSFCHHITAEIVISAGLAASIGYCKSFWRRMYALLWYEQNKITMLAWWLQKHGNTSDRGHSDFTSSVIQLNSFIRRFNMIDPKGETGLQPPPIITESRRMVFIMSHSMARSSGKVQASRRMWWHRHSSCL